MAVTAAALRRVSTCSEDDDDRMRSPTRRSKSIASPHAMSPWGGGNARRVSAFDETGSRRRSKRMSISSHSIQNALEQSVCSRRRSVATYDWDNDDWQAAEGCELPLRMRIHAIFDAQGLEEEVYASRHQTLTNGLVAFSFVMIVMSVMILAIESLPQYYGKSQQSFFIIEACCVAWFSFELLVRGFTCPSKAVFFKSIMNWIDIFAVVPFYVDVIMRLAGVESSGGAKELIVLRVIRLTRIFRVFKLSKYNEGVQVVAISLRESTDAISLLMVLLVLTVVLFGSGVYFAEQGAASWDEDNRVWVRHDEYGGPNVTHHFESLPQGFWWCLVTVTTVGYGDKYPVTVVGYLIAAGAMFAGLLIVAFPIIIIGAKFTEVRTAFVRRRYQREKMTQRASVFLGQRESIVGSLNGDAQEKAAPEVLEMKSDEDVIKELLVKIKGMQTRMTRMTDILALRTDEAIVTQARSQAQQSGESAPRSPVSPVSPSTRTLLRGNLRAQINDLKESDGRTPKSPTSAIILQPPPKRKRSKSGGSSPRAAPSAVPSVAVCVTPSSPPRAKRRARAATTSLVPKPQDDAPDHSSPTLTAD